MNLPVVNTPVFHGTVAFSPSATFGVECTIWQFATICDGVKLGDHVVIGSCAWIGHGTVIGDSTRIQHGAFLCKGMRVGRGVFIGPNVSCCDDKYPAAGQRYVAEPPILEDYCSIGAGAVILPGVTIGKGALIGAGSVVTQDVEPFAVVKGCPARTSAQTGEER